MFNKIYMWAKLVAVFCVIPLTVYTCLLIHSLRKASDEMANVVKNLPTQVDTRIGKLQTDVMNKIDTVQDKLNTEITTLSKLADKRIGSLTTTTDDRIGKLQTDVFKTVNGIGDNLNTQLTTTNNSVTKLVTAYADVPKVVGERYERDFGSFIDCSKNKLCLQGQLSDTMFAMRQSNRDTSETMAGIKVTLPQIETHILTISNTFAHDIPIMTTNIAGITQNINTLTKPKWYDRVLGYALNGVIIYRNMNPVTNLTMKAAQTVSSQK